MMARRPSARPEPKIALRSAHIERNSLGDELRGHRASSGKSLIEIGEELKIRPYMIVAIENADCGAFVDRCFIPSHVKGYARFLGLDAEDVFHRFCHESGFVQWSAATPGVAASDRFRMPRLRISRSRASGLMSIGILALFIGLILYLSIAAIKEFQQLTILDAEQADVMIAAPWQSAPRTSEESGVIAPPLVSRRQGDDEQPIGMIDVDEVGLYGPLAGVGRQAAPQLANPSPASTPALTAASTHAATPSVNSTPVPAPSLAATSVPEADPSPAEQRIELFSSDEVWVKITTAGGDVVLERLMQPDETQAVPSLADPLLLRAGKPSSLYLRVDGRLYGPAHDGPGIVKNMPLSAASVTANLPLVGRDGVQGVPLASGRYTADGQTP